MNWLLRMLRRNRVEARLDAELRDHIERQVADYIAGGMNESEARRRTAIEFGGLEQIKELCRDARGTRWLDELVQDIGYGIRLFRNHRSFTIAAVLSLALGIGVNTALFTLVDAAVLKPLPVDDPERLLELLTDSGGDTPSNAFTYQALVGLRERATTVDVIASHASQLFVQHGNSPPELAAAQYVTGDYFQVLGLTAAVGRALASADDRPEAPPVAVLSHQYWQVRWSGDPSIVGRTLELNDRTFTVVGVIGRGFRGTTAGAQVDLWVPLSTERLIRSPSWTSSAAYNWLQIIARIRPGRSFDEARAELSALYRGAQVQPKLEITTDAAVRERIGRWRPAVGSARSGLSQVRHQYAEPLFVLWGISGLVLLIACVNVANLLLARTSARQHELAVRVSLGARPGRIIRQMLTESWLLAFTGAAVGVLLAYAICAYLLEVLATQRAPMAFDVAPDARVLTFTAGLAFSTGILFGVAPALRIISRAAPIAWFQSSGRSRGGREPRRLGRLLVAMQVSLSVVMLFAAGLFLRSLHNLRSIEKGFDSNGVVIVTADGSRSGLDSDGHRRIFREAIASLASIPGTESVSLAQITPIQGGGIDATILVRGSGSAPSQEVPRVYINMVGPGYFRTLGMSIHAGRDFTWQDVAAGPGVALINQTMARRYFPEADAIGRYVERRGVPYEIVGIVGDAKYISLQESVEPTVFLHWFQQPDLFLEHSVRSSPMFAIRTAAALPAVEGAARATLRAAAPAISVTAVRTLEQQIDDSIVRDRALSLLSGLFAALGLALSAVGLYGLIAYSVSRRTGEIGIRMALGARTTQIIAIVVRETLLLTSIGVAAGLVAAVVVAARLSTLLFQLTPLDPITAAIVALLMLATGLAAAFLPGRRAARVDPAAALRAE